MFDIVVLGATGFTGRLIIRYLHAHPQRASFTFALGVRSKAKGEALKKSLGVGDDVPILHVDVTDYDSVEAAVKETKVVINVAGPFWTRGENVVKACALHGKRYVDLSGELHFVRKMISKYDYLATKTGAIIVPSCGYVCIPADLLVYLSNRTLKDALGQDAGLGLSQTFFGVEGSISGGTFATLMSNILDVPRIRYYEAERPYAISQVQGHPAPPPKLAARMPYSSKYGGFWFEGITDRGFVNRTFGLNEFAAAHSRTLLRADEAKAREAVVRPLTYGPQFRYEEYMLVGSSWAVTAVFSYVITNALKLVFSSGLARWILLLFVPKPGDGPSEKTMAKGWTEVTNYTASATSVGVSAKSVFRGKGDPGYLLTAYMIAECALALALDDASLPVTARSGGILTPATAFGDVLIKRLESTDCMRFETELVRDGDESRKRR